jgi:UDP-glucose 4-epimerase
MSILVTGGAGYIGSHFVHLLVDSRRPAIVLDDLSAGISEAIPSNIPFVHGDVGDYPLLIELIRKYQVRSIVHFAASVVVSESVANPIAYYNNNSVKTCSLIRAALDADVRQFVFSSTAAVYGNIGAPVIDEDMPTSPTSPYGNSKLVAEMMLRDVSVAHDFRFVALRYFNVAGADPKMRVGQSTKNATHLVKVAVQAAIGTRKHLDIFGNDYPTEDGTCVRDYIHVTDLVNAHLSALQYLENGRGSTILNCGYGRGHSVLQVAEAVKRISGVDFSVRLAPRRPGDPARIVADASRIRKVLGWRPKLDNLDQIVEHAINWERKLARAGS